MQIEQRLTMSQTQTPQECCSCCSHAKIIKHVTDHGTALHGTSVHPEGHGLYLSAAHNSNLYTALSATCLMLLIEHIAPQP